MLSRFGLVSAYPALHAHSSAIRQATTGGKPGPTVVRRAMATDPRFSNTGAYGYIVKFSPVLAALDPPVAVSPHWGLRNTVSLTLQARTLNSHDGARLAVSLLT